MKKVLAIFLVLLLLAGALAITGCGANRDRALVGTWIWDGDPEFVYIFNANGTGERGFPGHETTFTWTTSDNILNFRFTNTSADYARRWDYTINGSILTIDSHTTQETFSYIRIAD